MLQETPPPVVAVPTPQQTALAMLASADLADLLPAVAREAERLGERAQFVGDDAEAARWFQFSELAGDFALAVLDVELV